MTCAARIEVLTIGTFTYTDTDSYSGGDPYDPGSQTSDASKGYDGLDANGDPKDNGGTYAGAL